MSNNLKRAAEADSEGQKPAKKRRKKAKKQEDDGHLDLENSVNLSIALMDNQLLSDYFARMVARSKTNLTSVELADLSLTASFFRDTTTWEAKRTSDELPNFLENFTADPKELKTAPDAPGAPHTLIVTAAAMRAADLVRTVRKFANKKNHVSKLFAKHMKVEEQAEALRKTRTGIAVGTPARLIQLIENGALSLNCLQRIVVDASHIDQKKMGILEVKDTMLSLARFLALPGLKERYAAEAEPLSLLFY